MVEGALAQDESPSTHARSAVSVSQAPVLSVLIVNWNTRELTLACLRSLFEQTRDTPFEAVLVDNGSADGSAAAIAREFPRVRLLAETVNHGFAAANNLAARAAAGEYLLLLNTDTLVLDGAVDTLMRFARAEPSARIWGGRTLFADGSLNPMSCWNRITPWGVFCSATGLTNRFPNSARFNPEGMGGWQRDTTRPVDVVSGCFFLIETALWRELSGFDPAFFMYGEENDLCARARAAGARPMFTPDAAIVHYGGASEVRRTDTIVYILGARVGLARRQIAGLRGWSTRRMMLLAAGWRALAYGIGARTGRERLRAPAAQWREVWARRGEWKHGPPPRAL